MSKKVKCLIYCTKAKPYLTWGNNKRCYPSCACSNGIQSWHLNGKVVASFECEKIEKFDVPYPAYFGEVKDKLNHITDKSCLSLLNLHHYLRLKNGYAIYINNLEVFEEPKELSNYYLFEPNNCILKEIKKAPQNMCRVIEHDRLIYSPSEEYVLISIKPKWVEQILNGEKTIEVRKKILKAMEELI